MLVSEILRIKGSTLFVATPETSVAEAVHSMASLDIGSLVVMEKGKLVGMLTFRELIKVLDERGDQLKTMTVGEIMERDPLISDPAMDVQMLRKKYAGAACPVHPRHRRRHVDGGRFVSRRSEGSV